MAIDTTYGGGNTSTVTQSPALDIGGGDMEFWREMARRSMAKQQQPAQQPMMGAPMRRSGGSGTGPVTRERVRSSGPMGGGAIGGHSFGQFTQGLGLNQATLGDSRAPGMMRSMSGTPGAVYTGWALDQNPGGPIDPYRVQNGSPQYMPDAVKGNAIAQDSEDARVGFGIRPKY